MTGFAWHPGRIGRVEAGGKSLEAVCYGPPPSDAATVLMLHEGLGCIELWRDFPKRIAAETGLGVFAFSRAGHGHSDRANMPRPAQYMTDEAVKVLPDVLDAFGFRRGVLLGHSDGATIAAIYAGSVPDLRVRGLVLVAPHFFTEQMGLAEIARARQVFASTDLKDRMAKYHADPAHVFLGWSDVWLSDAFKTWNVADVIDHWRIPVLAIQGRDDQYGTTAQIEEIVSRIYSPVEPVLIEGCRHAPQEDAPQTTMTALVEFIARLERIEAEEVRVA